MSDIVNRLSIFFTQENISIRQAEIKIGAANGTLSRAIKNNRDIQSKWVSKIVEEYNRLNPLWLIMGRGVMLLETPFRSSLPDAQGLSDLRPSDLLESVQELIEKCEDEVMKTELVNVRKKVFLLMDQLSDTNQRLNAAVDKKEKG